MNIKTAVWFADWLPTFYSIAKILAMLGVAAMCMMVGVGALRAENELGRLADNVEATAVATQVTLQKSNKALDKFEQTEEQQRLYLKVISHDAARAVESANRLIQNTDYSINARLVPEAEKAIKDGQLAMLSAGITAMKANEAIGDLTPILNHVAIATRNLAEISDDPGINLAIRNMATTSKNTAETTENVAATTKDIRDAVHGWLHPPKRGLGYRIGMTALEHIWQLRQALGNIGW